jgi:hypothetical protein
MITIRSVLPIAPQLSTLIHFDPARSMQRTSATNWVEQAAQETNT